MLYLLRARALFLPLALAGLLAGCQSPRLLFRFPAAGTTAEVAPPRAVPAAMTAAAVIVTPEPSVVTAAPAVVGRPTAAVEARRPVRRVATLGRLALPGPRRHHAQPAAASSAGRLTSASAAAGLDPALARRLERGALLVGLGSFALAVFLKLVISAAGLATLVQLLFYVSAFALALWFGLLLLRAMKES